MAMTKRTRSKGLKKSGQLLGSGTDIHGYGIGVIGPDPRRTDVLLVVVFAGLIALCFIFLGVILVPGVSGVLLVAAVYGSINRPASVAVTNQGIAILARSELSGQPRKVLTVLPDGVLTDATIRRSGAYVHLPTFHLWFRKKEYERLLAAGGTKLVAPQWAPLVPAGVAARLPSPPFPVSAPPNGAVAIASSPPAPTMAGSPTSQPENGSAVIYCSWCGKQRMVDAQAIHYCGSMERPVAYCMQCGTSLDEGAATCSSCGTPTTQISR
jgi:hypothetical protein